MVRREEDIVSMLRPSPFQGTGEITMRDILNRPEGLREKGRVFAHTTVHPGSGVGYHVHDDESEAHYIINGTGTSNDNGKLVEIGPGDVTFTGDGEGHGIEATNGESIEVITLILYHNIAQRRNIHDCIISIYK